MKGHISETSGVEESVHSLGERTDIQQTRETFSLIQVDLGEDILEDWQDGEFQARSGLKSNIHLQDSRGNTPYRTLQAL